MMQTGTIASTINIGGVGFTGTTTFSGRVTILFCIIVLFLSCFCLLPAFPPSLFK